MIRATAMGRTARQLLRQEQEGVVMGVTARGIFLRLACGWVIFLSKENYRAPLTVNLEGDLTLMQVPGTSTALIREDGIFIPDANVHIQTRDAEAWVAPPRPERVLPTGARSARLESVIRLATAHKGSIIPSLLTLLGGDEAAPGMQSGFWAAAIHNLRTCLRQGQVAAIMPALEHFLGYGGGLTPAGDDLALGLLLAGQRWGDVLAPGLDWASLSQVFLLRVVSKTTTLSANLLECAANGQADERLVLGLDGLMSGNPDAAACAALFAGWGNSSGLDALAGMGVILF